MCKHSPAVPEMQGHGNQFALQLIKALDSSFNFCLEARCVPTYSELTSVLQGNGLK